MLGSHCSTPSPSPSPSSSPLPAALSVILAVQSTAKDRIPIQLATAPSTLQTATQKFSSTLETVLARTTKLSLTTFAPLHHRILISLLIRIIDSYLFIRASRWRPFVHVTHSSSLNNSLLSLTWPVCLRAWRLPEWKGRTSSSPQI